MKAKKRVTDQISFHLSLINLTEILLSPIKWVAISAHERKVVGSNLVPSKILKGNAADAEYMARKISEFNPSSIKKKKTKI